MKVSPSAVGVLHLWLREKANSLTEQISEANQNIILPILGVQCGQAEDALDV